MEGIKPSGCYVEAPVYEDQVNIRPGNLTSAAITVPAFATEDSRADRTQSEAVFIAPLKVTAADLVVTLTCGCGSVA